MSRLVTIFSSNIPVDCHILKGRLETEGIVCFLFDENIGWVHPFRAVAVGGIKLKVPYDQVQFANGILEERNKNDLSAAMDTEIRRQNEILEIRAMLRANPGLMESKFERPSNLLNQAEIIEIVESEQKFRKLSEKHFHFTWKQFWYELFAPERDFFKYLCTRPVDYYIEKELVSNYQSSPSDEPDVNCLNCHFGNVRYGHAIDYKWDILYMILSVLVYFPFPPYRKKYFCFNCKTSFTKSRYHDAESVGKEIH